MKTEGEIVAFILLMVACFGLCLFGGYVGGRDSGATAIAAGTYKAELIVKPDKTTEWKFTKAGGGQ